MLEKIALRLTTYMIEKEVIPADDEEVYVYGWSLVFSQFGSLLLMILIAALVGEFIGGVIFLAFTFPLRSYAGGFHASTYLRCFITSMSGFASALLLALFWPERLMGWTLLLLVFSVLVTFIGAPVDHPNKPLKDHQKKRNKKLSRIIVSTETAVVLSLWFLLPVLRHYLFWGMLGMALTSLTLLYVLIRPYKEQLE